jgi:hypothetical protein
MAKSTRSKVKRSFRKAKRDDSIFAVTHAARLGRLSQKLTAIARPTLALKTLEQADEAIEEKLVEEAEEAEGWQFYALLGLVDPDVITIDTMTSRSQEVSYLSENSSPSSEDDLRFFEAWRYVLTSRPNTGPA